MMLISTHRRRLATVFVAVCLAMLVASSAAAIPPGGASPDTPGTSSVVWPTLAAPGEAINFHVTGYPAGETLSIKIDDGLGYSDTSQAGSGVVHMQAIKSDGTVTGSLILPDDIEEGKHWLRFLASEPILDDAGAQIGVKGFTRRGGADFTVATADTVAAARTTGTDGPQTMESALAALEAEEAAKIIEEPKPETIQAAGETPSVTTSDEAAAPVTPTDDSTIIWLVAGGVVVIGVLFGVIAGRRRTATT